MRTLQELRGYPQDDSGEEREAEEEEEDTSQGPEDFPSMNEIPPASVFRQHEAFMERQIKMAVTYQERRRRLPVVSSKQAVDAEATQESKRVRVGGARTVSSAVKNKRRKLKKKRKSERMFAIHISHTEEQAGPAPDTREGQDSPTPHTGERQAGPTPHTEAGQDGPAPHTEAGQAGPAPHTEEGQADPATHTEAGQADPAPPH